MTTNAQTPSWEQLLDWVEGRLSTEEGAQVAAQLAATAHNIATDMAWLRAFSGLQRDVVLDEPPPQVHSKLLAQFDVHVQKKRTAATGQEGPGLMQRLLATLTFDSGLQPLAVGLRTADASDTRQLIFSTAAADVMLNIQTTNAQGVTVNGRILPLTAVQVDAFDVQLLAGETPIASTQSDALGAFVFDGLRPATYQLLLNAESLAITVGPFELQ